MPIHRIASFTVDHDLLKPGIYISRIDGDVITYDLRTCTPNAGVYMDNCTMHSVEHMFATFIRNSEIAPSVLYFGPMGCQTGFYLLVRSSVSQERVLQAVLDTLQQILDYDGPVFGASRKECGNYRNLNLQSAKTLCRAYLDTLRAAQPIDFQYQKE
ncbi:MAG: S-ribosylhomocysteine lyase [Clostridiales bacterium]|nr:S-ribosylhomocysteine lyase [Clostridiales bacterium]